LLKQVNDEIRVDKKDL